MILYVKGDLFQSPAQVLVNTVNTVGAMGRGVALTSKKLFPEMYRQYRELCESGKFDIGMLWLYKSENKWILNFPTKKHWRYPSRIEYIDAGLQKFVKTYADYGIHSIAFPALGCGNGQLDFDVEVKPLMEKYLRNLPIEIFVYPGDQGKFVEHVQHEEMRAWLRSEPSNLPFSEVWEDLQQILNRKSEFRTIAKKSHFTAYFSDNPPGIRILSGKTAYTLHYEILMAFWQQLRSYGFSMRNIAPGFDRQMSYVIPIFSELEYIAPVQVADKYDYFQSASMIGLQILPSAFTRHLSQPQFAQLPLF